LTVHLSRTLHARLDHLGGGEGDGAGERLHARGRLGTLQPA
jgi:hypothetical protein